MITSAQPMPRGTATVVTIDQLVVSPYNVRRAALANANTAELEQSILDRGVIEQLCVHPMRDDPGKLGVAAGGRRMRSIRRLIDRGDLAPDFSIPARRYDLGPAELIALSMAENVQRLDMELWELCAGAAQARAEGATPAEIAAATGQTEQKVIGWLAIADLQPDVFEAFRTGEITALEAQAYRATEDHDHQLQVLNAMRERPRHLRTPEAIRAALKVNDRDRARQLAFVGEEAYRAAGGVYTLDLFAPLGEHRGIVASPEILDRLVREKMDGLREVARERAGRPVRFLAEPPRSPGGIDWELEIEPEFVDDAIVLPDGDVVASLRIGDEGEAELRWWWASRKARRDAAGPDRRQRPRRPTGVATGVHASPAVVQYADQQVRAETGISRHGVDAYKGLRRAALRAMLVQDAERGHDVGIDLLVWGLLRQAAVDRIEQEVGTGRISGVEADGTVALGHIEASPAGKIWETARRRVLASPAFADADPVDAFLTYRCELPGFKRLAAAIAAGQALDRSLNADLYYVPVHDAVAAECGRADDASVRELVPPTFELIALTPEEQLKEIVEPFVGADRLAGWARQQGSNLAHHVYQVLIGAVNLATKEAQLAALEWVHPLLRFEQRVDAPDDPERAAQLDDQRVEEGAL